MQDAKYILDTLHTAGFLAYIVGGFVRDQIKGTDSNDIDIATNASHDQIKEVFKSTIVIAGKVFPVAYVNGIEVATFRTSRNSNEIGTIETDLVNRDLSINAIALRSDGSVVDPLNGRQDIQDNVLRLCIGSQTIIDDPIRILRACRFLAVYEASFTIETFNTLRECAHLIPTLDKERIGIEIFKTVSKAKNASIFFEALARIGGLQYVLPSLNACCGFPHGEHHVENVFEHSIEVGDFLPCKDPVLKLAGYLHDVGKPPSYDNGKFIDHETVGAELLRVELTELRFSNDIVDKICGLAATHMVVLRDAGLKSVRRSKKKLYDLRITEQEWFRLRIADHNGNVKHSKIPLSELKRLYTKLTRTSNESIVFDVTKLAISGGGIIKILKTSPGPEIGRIQKLLLSEVIDGNITNEVNVLTDFILSL